MFNYVQLNLYIDYMYRELVHLRLIFIKMFRIGKQQENCFDLNEFEYCSSSGKVGWFGQTIRTP